MPASGRVLRVMAVALLAAGCVPTAVPPSPSLLAASSPSGTPAPVTTPAPTPAPTPTSDPYSEAGVGWEAEFVFMEDHGFGTVKGLLAGGPGFVLWSSEPSGRVGFLISPDGTSWNQIDSTATGRTMLALAAGGAGLVGLAADAKGRIERWSSADGTTWTTALTTGISGTPTALLVTSAGYLAAGRDATGCGFAAWASTDALTWTPAGALPGGASTCLVSLGGPAVDQLLTDTTGFLAIGHLSDGAKLFWSSPDGRTWQRLPAPAGGVVEQVARGGPGFVAVGHSGGTSAKAAAWTSPDGITWTAAPSQASFAAATMLDVVTLTDGSLVAGGSERRDGTDRFAAWTSSDGLTWQRSPDAVCEQVSACDRRLYRPTLLATDGRRLVGFTGSIDLLVSPVVTVGLRPAAVAMGFDNPPPGDWTSGPVGGTCVAADSNVGPSSGTEYAAQYPTVVVVDPAAAGSSTYHAEVQLDLAADGSVLRLIYDRGDTAGFSVDASVTPAVGLDQISVDSGSTLSHGRLEFRNLPVTRDDPSLPAVGPVSGWSSWSCG